MNQRLIKFRAWDTENKKMYSVDELNNIWDIGIPVAVHQMQSGNDIRLRTDENPLMQFTGLLDKENQEIFEGDVVKTMWQHDGTTNYDYEVVGEIIWYQERCQWDIHWEKNGEIYNFPLCSFEREELNNESIEIIGNIYEHSHLLNNMESGKISE